MRDKFIHKVSGLQSAERWLEDCQTRDHFNLKNVMLYSVLLDKVCFGGKVPGKVRDGAVLTPKYILWLAMHCRLVTTDAWACYFFIVLLHTRFGQAG